MKPAGVQQREGVGLRMGFRGKLTIAMMVVVSGVTGLAMYLAQRNSQSAYQETLQVEFQTRSEKVFSLQDALQTTVADRCRALARSVRIRAALEEDDLDDLYKNADVELREVLNASPAGILPRVTFYRFLDPKGHILKNPDGKDVPAPLAAQIEKAGINPRARQQIGYVTAEDGSINKIVSTPIIGDDGEMLGGLALVFLPAKAEEEIKTGVWIEGGELQMPELSTADHEALAADLTKAIGSRRPREGNFVVRVGEGQYQLFYRLLNPGSGFAAAYDVCLYSLEGAQEKERQVQWKIVGVGLAVLVLGLVASNFFSVPLSKPVEQLAEVSAKNIALREQAETEMELTEQKYRSIFENAVEGIFLLSRSGKYLSANPAMARIFGYDSPEEFIAGMDDPGQKLYDTPVVQEEFMRLAGANGVVSSFETQMCRKDGTKIWVSQNARAVRNSAGDLLHFEGTLEDITERKSAADSLREVNIELQKALADLKTTQQQIIQQERLRALGQMASGIAHDFNNALMPVTGFAELLLLNPSILDDKKKAASYLEIIQTAASDAGSIVARLREFYRTNENSDVFTQVDLKRLARQVVSLTQPKWKTQAQASGVEIRISEMLDDVPPIAGDESALREVLTNLIFNAVDAMAKGGTITLRTFSADEQVTIEVSDSGAGMSEEVRARCMEPFFSTKGERGTGLGLAMVFGIVQRHEGKIDLRTKLGEGTTFALTFPMRSVTPKAEASGPVAQTRHLRVLVVDDEPQVRQVLTAFLVNEGHEVRTANDGVEGLRSFLDSKFDLVITDKAMPGMSGDQMAVAIRQFSSRMPIVLLTGFHNSRDGAELSGISVVATKPITMPELRETIDKAMKAA